MTDNKTQPQTVEPDWNFTPDHDEPDDDLDDDLSLDAPEVARPINWRLLSANDAEYEWLALNEWVHWLRITFGLPASVIPPFWHRHWELVWELSALHQHWLAAYDPGQHTSAAIGWMADFHTAIQRLRDWTATSGTRLDHDRPTRVTTWPGEDPFPSPIDIDIPDREEDFVDWMIADVNARAEAEAAFLRAGDAMADEA